MSIKWMRAELKRIAEKIGTEDEETVLVMLTVVDCRVDAVEGEMDYPETVGHSFNYPVLGVQTVMHFPLCTMNSNDAANLAEAFILHVRAIESLRRPAPVGVMDMRPFPSPGAWIFPPLAAGQDIKDHVAKQYQLIIEARHEHT
ncbi:hypothetical protein [Pseudomonas sp. MH9.3]|uniref:hypothetical protein n=1 Tax=Pseudomonas sp. MH9.3 TaxID=3048630 RepID=UPI002AC8B74A|nr:hypothetical protein [Pseudomonas sp. MH9.3]MEB0108411.1 hypothetical protein [Pseudomonas sp. MH9.3]WPX81382.1 hypothetical protein RHM60_09805 [Pseudomonas sp. MH9.3]WQG56968.1 hypothetical protein RHM66_16910 [Pseudomonas sp. RTB3]